MIKTLYKKFQTWSEKGSVYIISDPHFGDEDMNWRAELLPEVKEVVSPVLSEKGKAYFITYAILGRINDMVHKNDTLIILGDIGDIRFLKLLKSGYKVLVLGNHDRGHEIYEPYVDEVYEGPLFISEKIVLSHEPMNWPFALNIHGHVHNVDGVYENSSTELNVSCELIEFRPVSLAAVIKSGALKKIDSLHRDTIDHATERNQIKGVIC